jgi:hypothetical protein
VKQISLFAHVPAQHSKKDQHSLQTHPSRLQGLKNTYMGLPANKQTATKTQQGTSTHMAKLAHGMPPEYMGKQDSHSTASAHNAGPLSGLRSHHITNQSISHQAPCRPILEHPNFKHPTIINSFKCLVMQFVARTLLRWHQKPSPITLPKNKLHDKQQVSC